MDLRLSKMTCVKPHHGRVSEQYLGGTVCVWGGGRIQYIMLSIHLLFIREL